MINWIIAAAGRGSRMNSNIPKVLHQINGKNLLSIASEVVNKNQRSQEDKKIIVCSEEMLNKFKDYLPTGYEYIVQKEQLGTGHAAKIGLSLCDLNNSKTIVLYADTPFIKDITIAKVIELLEKYPCVNLSFEKREKNQYAKILTNDVRESYPVSSSIEIYGIKEEKSFLENEERSILCNAGFMGFQTKFILNNIDKLVQNKITNEFYLPELFDLAFEQGLYSGSIICTEDESLGINTQSELKDAEDRALDYN
jgi:bifunctional UDP-N-acetylglucosamine pyrophosphorylase/glucosamine-1-phosphate N-acetyltransferase